MESGRKKKLLASAARDEETMGIVVIALRYTFDVLSCEERERNLAAAE